MQSMESEAESRESREGILHPCTRGQHQQHRSAEAERLNMSEAPAQPVYCSKAQLCYNTTVSALDGTSQQSTLKITGPMTQR